MSEVVIECIIGVDPGLSNGGIAVWKPDALTKVYKMPRKIEDFDTLIKHYKDITPFILVIFEKMQMWMSDSNEENKGKQFGIERMVKHFAQLQSSVIINKIPYIQVHPIAWQKYLRIYKEKEEKKIRKNRYKQIAQSRYPEVSVTLWNSDALLLVDFARRKIQFDEEWIQKEVPPKVLDRLRL